MIGSLLDTTLDRTVVGAYTSIGYRLRSESFQQLGPMHGTVIAITGAAADPAADASWHHRRKRPTHLLPVTGQDPSESASACGPGCLKLSGCHEERAG